MGMKCPLYHNSARSTISLAVPWHSVAKEIADLNLKIVTGQLNKRMKSCHPAKPWGSKNIFTGVDYHTHNLEGYVPSPKSLVIPSKPAPTERTPEDQPFCLVHKHPDDPRELVDITSGSFSLQNRTDFKQCLVYFIARQLISSSDKNLVLSCDITYP